MVEIDVDEKVHFKGVEFKWEINGEEVDDFLPEAAAAQLLMDEVVYFAEYRYKPWFDKKNDHDGLVLVMNCGDVFAWGCADHEEIGSEEELHELYRYHMQGKSTNWVCKKRNMRPQWPLAKIMIADGRWDDEMQALPTREDWVKLYGEEAKTPDD
jgi:hypothetical protein